MGAGLLGICVLLGDSNCIGGSVSGYNSCTVWLLLNWIVIQEPLF